MGFLNRIRGGVRTVLWCYVIRHIIVITVWDTTDLTTILLGIKGIQIHNVRLSRKRSDSVLGIFKGRSEFTFSGRPWDRKEWTLHRSELARQCPFSFPFELRGRKYKSFSWEGRTSLTFFSRVYLCWLVEMQIVVLLIDADDWFE